jgi:hypothetical protein
MSALRWTLLWVVVLLSGRWSQVIQIRSPLGLEGLICNLTRSGQQIGSQSGLEFEFRCPGEGEVASFDGVGSEPLDIRVTELCRTRRLPLRRASTVQVSSSRAFQASVEWLDVDGAGSVTVVASRRFPLGREIDIAVAAESSRYLRFHRLGAAPLTIRADQLAGGRWELPTPKEGGELLVAVAQSRFAPQALRILGHVDSVAIRPVQGIASVSGLQPGSFRIIPIYSGGVIGKEVSVSVRRGQTSTLFVGSEAIGGVSVSADPDQCSRSSALTVDHVGPLPARVNRTVVSVPIATACRWLLSGLQPGLYRARLDGTQGSNGSLQFSILAQQLTTITLARPKVTLSGTVEYNGRPLGGATVFVTKIDARTSVPVPTDDFGKYGISLDEPGSYSLDLQLPGSGRIPQSKAIELVPGVNSDRWSLAGGSIVVRVTGADPRNPLRVQIVGRRLSIGQSIERGVQFLKREGFAFGTYQISAVQEQPVRLVSSSVAQVSLGDGALEREVELRLVRNSSTLIVRTASGITRDVQLSSNFMSQAIRMTGPAQSATLPSTSGLSLADFPAGSEIVIKTPGVYSPICRRVPLNTVLEVSPPVGRTVEIQFNRPGITSLSLLTGVILQSEGSECPIPLSAFNAVSIESPVGRSRFRVMNFPNAVGAIWQISVPSEYQQPIVIPATGPIILSYPLPK